MINAVQLKVIDLTVGGLTADGSKTNAAWLKANDLAVGGWKRRSGGPGICFRGASKRRMIPKYHQ